MAAAWVTSMTISAPPVWRAFARRRVGTEGDLRQVELLHEEKQKLSATAEFVFCNQKTKFSLNPTGLVRRVIEGSWDPFFAFQKQVVPVRST
jgi:hypothetical protein